MRRSGGPRGGSMLEVLTGEYALVSLPAHARPRLPDGGDLRIVIHDPHELTLVLEVSEWSRLAPEHPDARAQPGYRAIRLTQDFPLETVGVLAKLTAALAGAGVAIMAYSTFKTDVILVRRAELDAALGVLWDLRF